MRSLLVLGSVLLADVVGAGSATNTKFNPIENLFQPLARPQNENDNTDTDSNTNSNSNTNTNPNSSTKTKTTTSTTKNFQIPYGPDPNAPSTEEREAERLARRERNRQRRAKVADAMKKVRPDVSKIEKVSPEELNKLSEDHPEEFRKLWGGSGNGDANIIAYADPGDDYDMWQQAYRMLGAFIDCDHQKSEGSGDNGDGSGDGDGQACSRWMMWASVSTYLLVCTVQYSTVTLD